MHAFCILVSQRVTSRSLGPRPVQTSDLLAKLFGATGEVILPTEPMASSVHDIGNRHSDLLHPIQDHHTDMSSLFRGCIVATD